MNDSEEMKLSELLTGKVLGTLTKEQEEILSLWLENSDNKEVEKNILDLAAFDDWQEKISMIDTESNWIEFLNRMSEDRQTRMVQFPRYAKWAAVAASLLLLFAVYQIFTSADYTEDYQTVAEVTIEPGSTFAQLVLSTGEIVDLADTEKSIQDRGGISASNSRGVLEYVISDAEEVDPVTNTLRIPRGAEYHLELPDGTKVWLNSESELSYSVPFAGATREVSLKGEAYFEVTHDASHPFIVSTQSQTVQVLGTAFNISAYDGDEEIVTTLVEGKVKVASEAMEEEFLNPGEQVRLNKQSTLLEKQPVKVYPYVAWKDGRFVFKNESLESILSIAARWYDVSVEIESERLKQMRFTGDLPKYRDMKGLLKVLEMERSARINVVDNKKIIVSERE